MQEQVLKLAIRDQQSKKTVVRIEISALANHLGELEIDISDSREVMQVLRNLPNNRFTVLAKYPHITGAPAVLLNDQQVHRNVSKPNLLLVG
jgi:hypothetical protein